MRRTPVGGRVADGTFDADRAMARLRQRLGGAGATLGGRPVISVSESVSSVLAASPEAAAAAPARPEYSEYCHSPSIHPIAVHSAGLSAALVYSEYCGRP